MPIILIPNGFAAESYGAKNTEDEKHKAYFTDLESVYLTQKRHSSNEIAFMMDNNTYLDHSDERFTPSYTYQFKWLVSIPIPPSKIRIKYAHYTPIPVIDNLQTCDFF